MSAAQSAFEPVRIGIVSVSDRASSGVYADQGLPALQDWLTRALRNPITFEPRLIPDEQAVISATLIELVEAGCSLVLTTGLISLDTFAWIGAFAAETPSAALAVARAPALATWVMVSRTCCTIACTDIANCAMR